MPIVSPKVKVVRVDLDGAGGGSGAAFTLNGSTGSASLVAGTGISLASNLSTITISVINPYKGISATLTGGLVDPASTLLLLQSAATVSGAGIVSVGASVGSLTISASTPSVVSAIGTNGALSTGSIQLVAGNNISLSTGASSITIHGAAGGAAGTQSISGGGTSITGTAISLALVGGNNISLASASGAGSLTLTVHASSNALNNVSLLNASSGAMSVSAGAGIGIGQANSTITISASVQTSNVTLSAAGNTLSTASVTGTFSNSLVISGAGILSGAISTSGNTIILSASTPSVTNYSTISGNIVGNTAGSSTFTIGNTLQISLTGGLSGTASGSSITLSGATGGAAGTQSLSASANSVTGTAVSLALLAGAGVSLATTTAAGALTVTISNSSPNLFSTVSLSASGNTTSSSSGTFNNVLAFSGMGGASIGAGNGSVSISAPSQTTLVAGSGISLTSGGSSITIVNTGPPVKLIQNFDLHNAAGTVVSKAGTVTGTAGVGSSLFLSRITAPCVMSLTEIDVAMSIGFPATNQGAGTMSRSMVIYSFGNSTSLASVMSVSGTSAWQTGTSTSGAVVSLTQFQGGWSTPLIQPFTFASTSLAPGEYVVGQLFNFAQGSSTWTLAFYGDQAASSVLANSFSAAAGSGVTGTVAGSLVTGTAAGSGVTGVAAGSVITGLQAGSVITAITQNATNNISWFVSRATSAVTSVASATSSFTFLEAPFVGSLGTAAGSGVTGTLAGSGITGVAAGSVITGLAAAGSAITGVTAGSVLTASGSVTAAQLTIPNFGYIGTGSTTSGFPTWFAAGIMSTGAVPTAITLTSTAVTYSGSAAFQQPWFALVGV